jgi:hypothetical protein
MRLNLQRIGQRINTPVADRVASAGPQKYIEHERQENRCDNAENAAALLKFDRHTTPLT